MPYSYPDNVPDYVKELPADAQKACVAAFNASFGQDEDEDAARMACWGAVKQKYEKKEDKWVPKAKEDSMINLEDLNTVQKAYAAHNRLHAEYLDARHTARKKANIQEDHEAVVKHILDEMGGRHIAKGDALDNTLPQKYQKPAKLRYLCDNVLLSEEKPARSKIQVLRTGVFHHPEYGKFSITDKTLESMINNFNEHRPKAPTEMVVDFEHMSVAEPPVQAPAAGWVKGLETENGGLFADIEWTEDAAKKIAKREYRFVSPEFDFDYRDKETGKRVGPTLISVALTNRPFIEGMEPVILSEELSGILVLAEETSFGEKERRIREAYRKQFGGGGETAFYQWMAEVYKDYCVVDRNGELFKMPYTITDDEVIFDTTQEVKVEKQYVAVQLSEQELKEWDAKYINDLPDGCFAYIKSGGEKDEDGKTTPRALRYLPYRDKDGKIDLPHLRNALSRLAQTKLTPEEQVKARKVLIAAAKEAEVGDYTELPGVTETEWKEVEMNEAKLREILEIGEDEDPIEAITSLKAKAEKADDLQTKLTEAAKGKTDAEEKLSKAEAEKVVAKALTEGKILPKMKEWAEEYVLRDPKGFTAFVEMTEKVGPDLAIKGEGDGAGAGTVQLSEMETKIAARLGVSEEDLIKAKEAEMKAQKEVED